MSIFLHCKLFFQLIDSLSFLVLLFCVRLPRVVNPEHHDDLFTRESPAEQLSPDSSSPYHLYGSKRETVVKDDDDNSFVSSSQTSTVSEHLPTALFLSTNMMTNKALIPTQPVALRTAMK
jgi:hypothetical protein